MTNSIETLSHQVVDQIAAGEVIERPAQLIKELVENSLDAQASQIHVEFSDGGRFVRVTDNGLGIAASQMTKALDRFATSKIKDADDLWRLRSFGFRGEALASISSVSELTLISRPPEAPTAAKVVSRFGSREVFGEVSAGIGTTVNVDKLFENVPARLKFLKSAAAEATQIKTMLKAMALAHPQVEFRVTSQGELVYFWPRVQSRLLRARQVLGIENLYEGWAEREHVRAHSVFADPNTTAKTSKQMFFFAQNRWVQDRGLQAGVTEAFRNLLMHGEYPISVTWIETDPEKIDVNIHPTKAQVKFLDPSLAFRATQASVRDTLEKAPWIEHMPLAAPPPASERIEDAVKSFSQNFSFQDASLQQTFYKSKPALSFVREEKLQPATAPAPAPAPQRSSWTSLQILGQAHLTYLVTQSREGLMLIDQHAAHERVLFEKLMHSWKAGGLDIQDFLFPITLELTADQVEALLSQQKDFEKLGLFFEQMGPQALGVRAAPALIKESILPTVLVDAASEILELGGSYSFENSLSHLCATMACHSAVRAGQSLSVDEMQALLKGMDEFPLSTFCPHGRPVYVEYPIVQIERDFGRTL